MHHVEPTAAQKENPESQELPAFGAWRLRWDQDAYSGFGALVLELPARQLRVRVFRRADGEWYFWRADIAEGREQTVYSYASLPEGRAVPPEAAGVDDALLRPFATPFLTPRLFHHPGRLVVETDTTTPGCKQRLILTERGDLVWRNGNMQYALWVRTAILCVDPSGEDR